MQRKALDRLVSWIGLLLTAVLLIAGSLLTWGHYFVQNEVHSQLSPQEIHFPAKGSAATAAPQFMAMNKYAGQKLTTGAQVETYADHFIANHLQAIGGGKTYAQLSAEAQADPSNTELAATVETVFKGETLRRLLLNAYAVGTMGVITGIAAFIAAALMLAMSLLGLVHAGRTPPADDVLVFHDDLTPVAA